MRRCATRCLSCLSCCSLFGDGRLAWCALLGDSGPPGRTPLCIRRFNGALKFLHLSSLAWRQRHIAECLKLLRFYGFVSAVERATSRVSGNEKGALADASLESVRS